MGRSDAELLEASRRGERDAFGALIERCRGSPTRKVVSCPGPTTCRCSIAPRSSAPTPAFVINGKRAFGNMPLSNMRQLVDQAIADL
jgi:hypothetical protein